MDSKKGEGKAKSRKRSKSPGSARGPKRKTCGIQLQEAKEDTNSTKIMETKPTVDEGKSKQDLCFKNPEYREAGFATKTKTWKNLKQIMSSQKSQALPDEITYASIDAPPPTKPVKKYSDISGLPALYTDPHTRLRYSNSDEYRQIQHISSDTVVGLLALRQAPY